MTKKTLEWLFLIFAIGGLSYYYLSKVIVLDGERIICHDEKHQGSTLLEDKTRILSVHRWKADEYRVSKTLIVCPACGARRREEARQAQIRQAREERLVRERAEIEKIKDTLKVERFYFVWHNIIDSGDEQSLRPGSQIGFGFKFKNCGTKPIPAGQIKVLIEPVKYLAFSPHVRRSELFGYRSEPSEQQVIIEKGYFNQFFGSGAPFKHQLNPEDSPYYSSSALHNWISTPSYNVCLRKDLKPGQDIFFDGYIIYKGHKIHVGTVTVHVMHPE